MMKGLQLLIVGLLLLGSAGTKAQTVALKTNLAFWGTTTPNLGVEVRLTDRFTLDLFGSYNPWTFDDGMRLRHVLVQPELRYWFCGSFQRHFIGLHAHYADFNVGNIPFLQAMKEYVYRGDLMGAGLSYGYHLPLGAHWAAEASLGVGYAYMKYGKYVCKDCADLKSNNTRHYIGPTKVAVSLIYLIR